MKNKSKRTDSISSSTGAVNIKISKNKGNLRNICIANAIRMSRTLLHEWNQCDPRWNFFSIDSCCLFGSVRFEIFCLSTRLYGVLALGSCYWKSALQNWRLRSFAWEISLKNCHMGPFVWRFGVTMLHSEILRGGLCVSFSWPSTGSFWLGASPRCCRLRTLTWGFKIGNVRSVVCSFDLVQGKYCLTPVLPLGTWELNWFPPNVRDFSSAIIFAFSFWGLLTLRLILIMVFCETRFWKAVRKDERFTVPQNSHHHQASQAQTSQVHFSAVPITLSHGRWLFFFIGGVEMWLRLLDSCVWCLRIGPKRVCNWKLIN